MPLPLQFLKCLIVFPTNAIGGQSQLISWFPQWHEKELTAEVPGQYSLELNREDFFFV